MHNLINEFKTVLGQRSIWIQRKIAFFAAYNASLYYFYEDMNQTTSRFTNPSS